MTTTGPEPGGIASTASVGSKCSGPTTTASPGQSGRATSNAGRVATSRRTGPGSVAGKPMSTRACARWRRPARQDRAVSARSMASRSRPRKPVPAASPLPTGGSPFDGWYSGDGFNSIHGTPSNSAARPPHTVITSDTTTSGASRAAKARSAPPSAPPAGGSSRRRRCRRRRRLGPALRARPHPRPRRARPSHSVPVSSVGASPAARNRRHSAMAGNACPGSGPATTATRTGLPCHSDRPLG